MVAETANAAELLHRAAAAGNAGDLTQAERLCRTLLADPNREPAEIPSLSAEPESVATWARRLPGRGFRVGIAWQGRADTPPDRGRSLPLRAAGAAGSGPQGRSDQPAEECRRRAIGRAARRQGGGAPDGFVDTAAVMMNPDLIVTSDTSIAHLAGALGRPVWLALRHMPDWRRMLDRGDSPWYPTARLFRQRRPGDWDELAERFAAALLALCGAADT